jgi:hypothetical protein
MRRALGRGIAVIVVAAICVLTSCLPAGAAVAAGRHPTIRSFRASVSALPSAGGSVRLTAAVKSASTCTFSVSPAVHGLPVTASCRRGSASRTVHVPASTAAAQRTYTFKLTVHGPGGTVRKAVHVVVREPRPAVSATVAAPADLPAAGGVTTVTAMVSRSATCTVSAAPAVAGLPVARPCTAGATPRQFSLPVALPPLAGATAQKYSLTLTVAGPGGTTTTSATGTVWPSMTFSAPVTVDAPAGWIGTVSCVSATFCMGIDLASGAAERWNGATWSAPVRLESGPYLDNGYDISISCVSAAFCLAVDASGNAFAYNGAAWSPVPAAGVSGPDVSCASPTFCMAAGGSQAAVFTGAAWSAPVNVASDDQIESVSCPTDAFCMAVTAAGYAYAYTASGWDSGTPFDAPFPSVQVSCASATLCAAVGVAGKALVYDGTWSAAATLNGAEPVNGVSCPAGSAFCLAVSDGSYYTTDGSGWSDATAFDTAQPSVVSCASATYCMMTDGQHIFVLSGTTVADSPAPGGPLHGFTYAISCPTPSFCVAVDWSGAYLTYNGTTWSAPRTISPLAGAADSVSCTSPAFCLAATASNAAGQGNIFAFNGQTWTWVGQDLPVSSVSCTSPQFCELMTYGSDGSVRTAVWTGTTVLNYAVLDAYPGFGPAPGQGQVSCVSPAFCVAVDDLGNAFTYDGTAWSAATALDPGWTAVMTGISCPTTTFCVAVDAGGHEYTFDGSTWTAGATIDTIGQPQAISCTVSHFCLMGDLSGNVATFDGATWSATASVDPVTTAGTGLTGVSCADAATCVAVDWEGNALTGTG